MQRIEDTLARKAEEIMTNAVTIEGNILRVAVTSEGRVVGLLNLRSIFGGKVLEVHEENSRHNG